MLDRPAASGELLRSRPLPPSAPHRPGASGAALGGLEAAPRKGSLGHAQRLRAELQQLANGLVRGRHRLEGLLTEAKRYHVWAKLCDASGLPFDSLEAFALYPQPFGLGYALSVLEDIIRERRDHALRARLLARGAKPLLAQGRHRTPGTEATTARCAPGTSAMYLVARLARDRPEFVRRLEAGEFSSAHQAAVAAGIAVPSFTVRAEPVSIARQLLKRLQPQDVQRVVELLTDTAWLAGPLGSSQRRRRQEAAA